MLAVIVVDLDYVLILRDEVRKQFKVAIYKIDSVAVLGFEMIFFHWMAGPSFRTLKYPDRCFYQKMLNAASGEPQTRDA